MLRAGGRLLGWGMLLGLIACLGLPAGAAGFSLAPIGSFALPVFVTSDPSDPNRLLVVEKQGRIRLLDGAESIFVDLTEQVIATGYEQGLLSVALAPDYASSGRLYVFYTRRGSGDLQIDELTASGDQAPLSSRRPVLTIPHPTWANHNGGQLQFGPDGYLYIGTGDGGNGSSSNNGQSLNSLLGKILRIDPRQSGAAPYTVPSDNPFVGEAGRDEIWSLGLRNPWRFSFDRLTGGLLIGDVGQAGWEEINYSPAPSAGRGVNFGWDCREGPEEYDPSGCPAPSALTDPILAYSNSGGSAVAGGYVVRDPGLEGLSGRYVYADTNRGQIRSLVPGLPGATGDRSEGRELDFISSFGEDSCGRVYVVSLTGPVYRLEDASPAACAAVGGGVPAAATCAGRQATILASARRLEGTPGDDVIVGVPGKNVIRGRGGSDLICGLNGSDRLHGGKGSDKLRGGHGADRCAGGPGRDRLRSC